MNLVFEICKGAGGKVEAKCLSRPLAGSICFKSDQASTPYPRAPPLSPNQAKYTLGFRCLNPYLGVLLRVLRAHTYLSPARSIDWIGICFGERQEGDELIVGEVRPVDSVLTI